MLELTAAWATDVGRVRVSNEDASYVGRRVWAVADGMGGHAAGEVASRLAIEALRALDDAPEPLDRQAIVNAVAAANAAIVRHGHLHRRTAGMGTTVCGIGRLDAAPEAPLCVFHVGDSRVYRFAGGVLEPYTTDHSEVAELVAAGLISPEEASTHPLRNIVTRCLGLAGGAAPDSRLVEAVAGDRWVLCSDGLNGELSSEAITGLLAAAPTPQEAVDALVAAALVAGGRDNVTVVVMDVADGTG